MRKCFILLLMLLIPITFAGAEEEMTMIAPAELQETEGFPELMRFQNGELVETPEDWAKRREELLELYSHYMYGHMPDKAGENLTYALETEPVTGSTLLKITGAHKVGHIVLTQLFAKVSMADETFCIHDANDVRGCFGVQLEAPAAFVVTDGHMITPVWLDWGQS